MGRKATKAHTNAGRGMAVKGEYQHTLDAKGRLFIPAKLREELGEHAVLTRGLDGCLFLYTQSEWDKLEKAICDLPLSQSRKLQRYLFSSASDVDLDKQGRIVVPPILRKHAGLNKDVTIIGLGHRAEVWDTERWIKSNEGIEEQEIIDTMQGLGF